MGRAGRPTATIELSDSERETLQRWVRRHSSAQALAQRSRIVLACAEGHTNQEVAATERVHPATVSKWRRRFAADRLEGLVDAPRPGAERTIADETIEAVVVDTLESTPGEDTHWSTRGLAAKHGISKTTVAEIWRAFGLKPWKQDSFKVSPDADLIIREGQRTGAFRFGDQRAMALAGSLCPVVHAVTGFTNKSLRGQVAGLLGRDYSSSQMSYDLRRLRLHGLIARQDGTNSYGLMVCT